mgnify:CR=1 FL=1
MVIRGEVTEENLKHIYKTIQSIIQDKNCYYTKEEIEKLKKDKKNIFIGGNYGR